MKEQDEDPDSEWEHDHPMVAAGPMSAKGPDLVDETRRAQVFGALFGNISVRRFGRYIVLGVLGRGGMGTVLKCYDEKLDRQLAIKVLHADLEGRRSSRLEREARALAKLGHPNVVQVFEVGEASGQLFVAMELVKGQTLRQWQREQAESRDWKECVRVYLQAGRGLAAAHAKGLVHRDFKPGNAIVDEDGRCRVLDFGLARRHDVRRTTKPSGNADSAFATQRPHRDNGAKGALEPSQTNTGEVVGTRAYMPPEQLSGKEADARSDQFSFCVSLYEALYGERPYHGDTPLSAIQLGEIRPVPSGSTVPAKLRRVLLRGLVFDPAGRWPSMELLLNELQALVAPRIPRWVVGAGLAMAITASVASVVAWWQSGELSVTQEQLTDREKQLAARIVELQTQKDRVEQERLNATTQLAAQKGLRAKDISDEFGRELEAIRVAVEAAEGLDMQAAPIGVVEGLTYSLAGAKGGVVLRGHTNVVRGVAVSFDGDRVVTASDDGTVRLWDTHSGALLRTFEGHQGRVRDVAFSPDGTWIATAGEDETVRLWDCTAGQQLDVWMHSGPVRRVAVSPEGQRIVFASRDSAWIWHLGPDDIVVPLSGHTGDVRDVRFSPDGHEIVTASEDHTVRVWNAGSAQTVRTIEGHTDTVLAAAFSPDGTRVASGGLDQTVRLWSRAAGQPSSALELGDAAYSVAFSPDGTRLATSTFDDGTARLWDVATGRKLDVFHHQETVFDVTFSPDGQRLATATRDFTARVWDLDQSRLDPRGALLTLGHDRRVDAVALSPDGTRIATGSGDGSARLWDAKTGVLNSRMEGHVLDVLDVVFSPDGQRLATASWDGSIRVWDVDSSSLVQTLVGGAGPVRKVGFGPDGDLLVAAGQDGVARVWSVATGVREHTFEHGSPLADAVFAPEGDWLVTVGAGGTVRGWDMITDEPILKPPVQELATAVAFSPDATCVAAAHRDHTVHVRSIATEEDLATLTGHSAPVTEIVFSASGRYLATASEDDTARVWDAATGTQVFILPHDGPVSHVAFSADGQQLATTSGDEQLRVWSLQAEAWLAWGCSVLTARRGHNEATRRTCSGVTSGGSSEEPEPRIQPEPVVVSVEPARPVPKSIMVHGVELVLIPAGTFTMGSPSSEPGREVDEGPQHGVRLDSFYLAKTELTNSQFALFLEANPTVPKPPAWNDERYNHPQQPVIAITWHEANAYCDWAGLVLPTEAQWEYAARGGTTSAYWFGDEAEDVPRFAWFDSNTGEKERGMLGARSHATATKGANAYGLYDMLGNAGEWTLDAYELYGTRVRAGDGLRKRPVGAAVRVIRGGGWARTARNTRAAYRGSGDPSGRGQALGFRPAMRLRAVEESSR